MQKDIKILLYDFDGVMTDNKVYVYSDGSEAVACHRGDGWAVSQFKKLGFLQWIISTELNPVVSKRAKKLGIPCLKGVKDKARILLTYSKQKKIDLKKSLYVGNDENDLSAMQLVRFRVAPADASDSVKSIANLVTKAKGGNGVIRELFDYFSKRKK